MSELPLHLLYPLTSSIVFTVGALFIKRASSSGVSPWTLTLIANLCAAVVFSFFWPLGGETPTLLLLWQPAIIAVLYICGQVCILSALNWADVSVVTPVASIKVLLVAALLAVFAAQPPSKVVWIAAFLATIGIALINFTMPKSGRGDIIVGVALAGGAALMFALFDVCLQQWATNWGIGRLPPIMYWMVGLFSLALLPLTDDRQQLASMHWKSTLFGSLCMALQATCLVYSLSIYQDAARINVVYALRGLWGVVMAWGAAHFIAGWFGGNESQLSAKTMAARLVGAALLVTAVVITIVEKSIAAWL